MLEYLRPFSTGMAATLSLGQISPDGGMLCNRLTGLNAVLSPDASTLCGPAGLAFDPRGNLWVADNYNNRVLEYGPLFANGMSATTVIGHTTFTEGPPLGLFGCSGPSANLLCQAKGLTFGSSGNLIVADTGNSRVLSFAEPFSNGMSANTVIGQPNFSANTPNNQPEANPTARTLFAPFGLTVF